MQQKLHSSPYYVEWVFYLCSLPFSCSLVKLLHGEDETLIDSINCKIIRKWWDFSIHYLCFKYNLCNYKFILFNILLEEFLKTKQSVVRRGMLALGQHSTYFWPGVGNRWNDKGQLNFVKKIYKCKIL
jgi:hypothetical protein